MTHLISAILVAFALTVSAQSRSVTLKSPDGNLETMIETGQKLTFTIRHGGDFIAGPCTIGMKLSDGSSFGENPVLRKSKQNTVRAVIKSPVYKRKSISDEYNELVLTFRGDYEVIFRAYNEGVAYRFVSNKKKPFQVTNEEATFAFDGNHHGYFPYVNRPEGSSFEEQLYNSFENTYTYTTLAEVDKRRLVFLPVLVETGSGKKVVVTESDLEDYPGMYVRNADGGNTLTSYFAAYPGRTEKGGHNQLQQIVRERENYIARVNGPRSFPWRVLQIAAEDKELADSDLVYKLASPSRVTDVSWIRPGKVAWDWWNDWNIRGVDFVAGVNTDTYKHYIDFAAENKIEYVILDEGWAVNLKADLFQIVPEIDLKAILSYARSKNVDIILWAGYNAFAPDMDNICRHYAAMGVKGFKVDFMDRDDQEMVNFYYEAAKVAARHKLLIDFHGAYKPTGLNRTYPNVINFEAVHGLEQMKWQPPTVDQVTYDVTIPFIRMLAGPMDYTQGATRNATRSSYRPVFSEPMSQGTRCRQLAGYVIFEAPLTMLSDAPSNYRDEPEMTQFISAVPTVWDQTLVLSGKVAEHIVIARQSGNTWYVGGMTNWDKRTLEIELSFLPAGDYSAEIFMDGVNAHRNARDFATRKISVNATSKLTLPLAPGGGYAVRITPVSQSH